VQEEGGRKHSGIVEKQIPDIHTTASAQKVLFCNQEDLTTGTLLTKHTTCIIRMERGKASRNSGKAS
jgi:hypothetical protein